MSGAVTAIVETVTSQAVVLVSPVQRPVASSAYGFPHVFAAVRFPAAPADPGQRRRPCASGPRAHPHPRARPTAIAVARSPRGPLARFARGSFTTALYHRAECAVVLVDPGHAPRAPAHGSLTEPHRRRA